MMKQLLFSAILLASMSACKPGKKTQTTTNQSTVSNDKSVTTATSVPEIHIDMDTITVSSKTATAEQEVYRASNTITNDLIHTKLEVSFDWTKSYMYGKATINLKPHFYPTNKLYLDARGMELKEVSIVKDELLKTAKPNTTGVTGNRKNLDYKYENDSIKITLDKVYTRNETYTIYIDYISKPNELKSGGSAAIMSDKGLYFVNPKGEDFLKMPQIWTQGETQASSVWFPTIDSPNQKMTQEIYMTVKDNLATLSNGILVNTKKNADGTKTDYWKMDLLHAPYLAMMGIGEFKRVVDQPWKGKEISYYVEKEYEPHAKAIFGDTKEMIDFYSKTLGVDYPWQKYAQISVRDYVSGAMENTSATLHGDFVAYQTTRDTIDYKKGSSTIAHELFHQWFGDYVTCESWSNLPLNESFATYGEYLWIEHKEGRDAADFHHLGSRRSYLASSEQKEVHLIRFKYKDKEEMFDGFSYAKGGQILHMLRKVLGDDAFFAGLKNYLSTNKFKAAEIHHLRLAFEETTGQDLNWFFNEWFLASGRPKLSVKKEFDAATSTLKLTIIQKQNLKEVPLYIMPLDIDIYINGTKQRTRVWMRNEKDVYNLSCSAKPDWVNIDGERSLLADIDFEKSKEELMAQYKTGALYGDRIEALKALEKNIAEPEVKNLFMDVAQKDKFFELRSYALQKLKVMNDKSELKKLLLTVYANDSKTLVKADALSLLNEQFNADADVFDLNNKALSNLSYAVVIEGLMGINKKDSKLAVEKAKSLENEYSSRVLNTIAVIYAANPNDNQSSFFRNGFKYIPGFDMLSYMASYAKAAKKFTTPKAAYAAGQDFESVAKGGGKFTKMGAVKALKDLAGIWKDKEATAKSNNDPDLAAISETKAFLEKAYAGVK
ncbi:MAG: M1 family metallopeptidase [Bacteroidota bacterium]|jgi:aminopeptidase N